MSGLLVPLPKRLPFSGMVAQMRPILHQLLEEAAAHGYPRPGPRLRVLETGSSGGLLTALLLETPLAERVVSADFADISPDTLEAAVERSADWPCRCHFINNNLHHLATREGYDIISTWSSFQWGGPDQRAAEAVMARQKPGGLLLQFHDQMEPSWLGFALHRYRLLGTRGYSSSGGREPKCANAWGLA